MILLLGASALLSNAAEKELLKNGNFEIPGGQNLPQFWTLRNSNGCKVSGGLVPEEGVGKSRALRLSNSAPRAPHVVGVLRQDVPGLEPGKIYRLSIRIKGINARRVDVVLGRTWRNRFSTAKTLKTEYQEYSWPILVRKIDLNPDGTVPVMLVIDDLAEAVWIDDFSLKETASNPEVRISGHLDSPYGVAAHLLGSEFAIAKQELEMFGKIGITHVRADLLWHLLEPSPGDWNFSNADRLMEWLSARKVTLLPILAYDTPWAKPVVKHLNAWKEYVRKVVSRYGDRIPAWEIWNEQNSPDFWKAPADPLAYTELLKASWETIKSVNPELKVLYGGVSGVPFDFIEKTLAAGAGKYFDVMNVHPYHWEGGPEQMIPELRRLRELMKLYRIDHKPIWITEVGWATSRPDPFYTEALPVLLKEAGVSPDAPLFLLDDPEEGHPCAAAWLDGSVRARETLNFCRLSEIAELDVKQYPLLFCGIRETFPARFMAALLDYVKRGGTLIATPDGFPFWYETESDGEGIFSLRQIGDKNLNAFHMGVESWWMRPGVPRKETVQSVAEPFAGKFSWLKRFSGRFLTSRNLKKGDRFIPVIQAGSKEYRGTVAAIYRLNSDLKGNVIVSTVARRLVGVSPEMQAALLARTMLVAFASGVDRVFWFEFQSPEKDPFDKESGFGIVRKNLEPKPACDAYTALTAFCPSGSTRPRLTVNGDFYTAAWQTPDRKHWKAVWSRRSPGTLSTSGSVEEIRDYLGKPIPQNAGGLPVTEKVIYLRGASEFQVNVLPVR